jgi:hypothetical protein
MALETAKKTGVYIHTTNGGASVERASHITHECKALNLKFRVQIFRLEFCKAIVSLSLVGFESC